MTDAKPPSAILAPVRRFFEVPGTFVLKFAEALGGIVMLASDTLVWGLRPPYRIGLWFREMRFVGVDSLFIILLTGAFTGMVFALESTKGFAKFNAESLVGGAVGLSLTRELAPVLTALLVTGRAGSAMAAEIGTMRVTEQIDALVTIAVNPVQYLVVPRVVAGLVMVPVLTVVFDIVGILGGYWVAVDYLGVDAGTFIQNLKWWLDPFDITSGLIKAAVFGAVLSLIGCYKGYHTTGGARGVGIATTQAVVVASVAIFALDFLLAKMMY